VFTVVHRTDTLETLFKNTGHKSQTYSRDAEAFVGHAGAGLL
jgi:hypothetical protein